jgi:hypothetical protein
MPEAHCVRGLPSLSEFLRAEAVGSAVVLCRSVEAMEMNADPKRKSHKGDYDRVGRARRHLEEALDDALKNTFPASDPVSIEQPTSATATRQEKD